MHESAAAGDPSKDRNVTIKPMAIKDVKVIETIKDGKSIYQRP
jgi:hypothetical protein